MKPIGQLFIIVLALSGCKAPNSPISYQASNTPSDLQSDQMIFLVFQIKAEESDKNKITLICKTIAQGKIKAGILIDSSKNHLQVSILNRNKSTLQSFRTAHPLISLS
jgi:hypothetical protein